MFRTVLVANRGEIAVRIMRSLADLGVRSVAVYSDADARALHVRRADAAVRIGPAPARESYLRVDRLIEAALSAGAEAIHPGYGFLSESPALARACADAGIVFIGPPIDVLELMGDKIQAKQAAIAAGVPVVPGRHDPGMDDDAVVAAVEQVGFPALLKPSAGGGGKGMRVVTATDDIRALVAASRREAAASFGDDTLLVERYLARPRHLEVQVLGDGYGEIVHLGERECTLQRRHQKVIEESPSPFLDDATREALCASAVRLAREVGYVGAGTVEYVVSGDDPEAFAFLEMNTRLQVEHPVTEMVTGVDLVAWQVRIAAGEELSLAQADIRPRGHAVEARVYAEDPSRGYLPTGGEVLAWRASPRARTDSGIDVGSIVTSDYDPMLAKVIVHAASRQEALHDLDAALADTVLLGVRTNIDLVRRVVTDPAVGAGDVDTGFLDSFPVDQAQEPPLSLRQAAAHAVCPEHGPGPWRAADGWRLGGSAPVLAEVEGQIVEALPPRPGVSVLRAPSGETWVHDPQVGTFSLHVTRMVERRLRQHAGPASHRAGEARSPMPGTVIAMLVAPGDHVDPGTPVAVVEAMKMEHTVKAPEPGGTVVWVTPEAQVRLDDVLVRFDVEEVAG